MGVSNCFDVIVVLLLQLEENLVLIVNRHAFSEESFSV